MSGIKKENQIILESKENNIQHTADNYPQSMPFNIYFNNSNENLINQQQHQQDQDSYSMQNNNRMLKILMT